MNGNSFLKSVLEQLMEDKISLDEAYTKLQPNLDLGFANLDLQRANRTGFPEVIYGKGKSTEQLIDIFTTLATNQSTVLATKVSDEAASIILEKYPQVQYNQLAKTLLLQNQEPRKHPGYIAIVCAGTSDLPVAEEAAETAKAMGNEVKLICDVGVAGLHRLFNKLEVIKKANVIVVVAGMEGALPSVVGGLVAKPIIAVPTSVGYGASFNGLAALLGMLNSCATGISVVNIDNGFGAGYQAGLINKLMDPTNKGDEK